MNVQILNFFVQLLNFAKMGDFGRLAGGGRSWLRVYDGRCVAVTA